MKKDKKVLAFAREAGGVSAISPVCKAMMNEGWNLLILSKDHGFDFFNDKSIPCTDFPLFDQDILRALVYDKFGTLPDLIFTSATSLPTLDMTEKYLWRWGKENGIKTSGLVDQWQNYAFRFSGPTERERLAYLPDYIFVMDELARDEMIKEGIPMEHIIITGQPALDKVFEEVKSLSMKKKEIRHKLGIPYDFTVVTFVAEALKKDFADALGYDEQSTIEFAGDTLNNIVTKQNSLNIFLLIRLHPENTYNEFEWTLSKWDLLKKKIVKKELSPYETLAISDIIIGMSSIMLIESIIACKPTIIIQLNAKLDSKLSVNKIIGIPIIKTVSEGIEIINLLLMDKGFREKYLQNYKKWEFSKFATKKCMKVLKNLMR